MNECQQRPPEPRFPRSTIWPDEGPTVRLCEGTHNATSMNQQENGRTPCFCVRRIGTVGSGRRNRTGNCRNWVRRRNDPAGGPRHHLDERAQRNAAIIRF